MHVKKVSLFKAQKKKQLKNKVSENNHNSKTVLKY